MRTILGTRPAAARWMSQLLALRAMQRMSKIASGDFVTPRGLVLFALFMLGGCATVGPDYVAPTLAVPSAWSRASELGGSGLTQRTENLAQWWQNLDDPILTDLVDRALKSSLDLRAAQARLREARARRGLAGANRFPTVTAVASGSRNKSSAEAGGGATRSLYSAAFDASWEPDIFGGTRRAIEAAQADLEASEAGLQATQVSLAAEVGLNYVEVRSFQARRAIAESNLAAQSETLQLIEWRAQAGLASSLEVEQSRANREQTRAQIHALETGLAEAEHRLAILLAQAPGSLHETPATPAAMPKVPAQVMVGIPADTLRQRPDVHAAERTLAAETARVGVRTADLYPSLVLSGSIGLEALSLGALGGDAATRSLAANLLATVFDGGRLRRQVEIQSAVQEQALVNYEATVLTALEDVENALAALANSRKRQEALAGAAEAARNAALLARQRYASGLIDYQTVLDTERSVLSVEDSLASAEAEQVSALVSLYKALGGGWSVASESPAETGQQG